MCLYPKLIKNPKYKANKKNDGKVPPVPDERVKWVPIGCTQCMECRKQKARGWQVRLLEDLKEHKNGKFVTLTFNNESLSKLNDYIDRDLEGYERDNEIATRATRLFLERWRKKYKKSLRHWLVTELGHNGTERIHLHGIVWTDESLDEVQNQWGYGWIWKGNVKNGKLENYVNEKTVNYIIKYVNKIDEKHKTYKSIILTSPGIGGNYVKGKDYKRNKYQGAETQETYRTSSGHKISLPIYWRNKIYTEKEREELWLNKLDKEERWINGEKVDISKGYKDYDTLLKWHRLRNKELGYGDDVKDWSREQYERERRRLMQNTKEHKRELPPAAPGRGAG